MGVARTRIMTIGCAGGTTPFNTPIQIRRPSKKPPNIYVEITWFLKSIHGPCHVFPNVISLDITVSCIFVHVSHDLIIWKPKLIHLSHGLENFISHILCKLWEPRGSCKLWRPRWSSRAYNSFAQKRCDLEWLFQPSLTHHIIYV